MKTPTPKKLFIRTISGNRISIGEYINAKWRNAVDPFNPQDKEALRSFLSTVETFKTRAGRSVEYVSKGGSEGLDLFTRCVEQLN